MQKLAKLGEKLDMDLVPVHDKVCNEVHGKERARMSESMSQPILRTAMQHVMEPLRPFQWLWAAYPS